jgi:oxygen-independent coproporphyrinogen-3 oxidase
VSKFDPQWVPEGSSLYLHVPFCSAICDFCAFDKALPSPGDWETYRNGIQREWSKLHFSGKVASVFWGGGTPGLLKASDIRSIGRLLADRLVADAEWTVELTPLCAKTEKLAAWRDIGVNRLSLGVQSFSPRLLEAMGRPYTTEKISRVVEKIRASECFALNLDLIIAFPGQTRKELMDDLAKAVALSPDHLSAYCLTLEEDTALYSRLARQGFRPDPEEEAKLYTDAWSFLEEQGFSQYEISNFARPGFQCRHHLNVWRMGNWRGLGPSAASQIGEYRFRNPHGLDRWAECIDGGLPPRPDDIGLERIDQITGSKERMAFGLRMNEGVSQEILAGLPEKDRQEISSFFCRLEEEGYLHTAKGHWSLSLAGRLVADEISRWILR